MEKLTNLMQKSGSVLLCVLAHSAVLISLGMRYGMIPVGPGSHAYVFDN